MNDPRIKRTHTHVLETARRMLSEPSATPLTLSTLAAEARVSRRTLYTHWGSIEKVVSDAVTQTRDPDELDQADLPVSERLELFLENLRSGIHERVTHAAFVTLMMQSSYDRRDASTSLIDMTSRKLDDFSSFVGGIIHLLRIRGLGG